MKKVFEVKFNRKNQKSCRYDIAVFYDVRSDCFGSDQVGQIQQSEFALWSSLYYLQERVEFWVNEESGCTKHYVFKTEDYGTRRKALSAAKKFVVEFFERNEDTVRAFETGGHNKCHCGNERCKSEKVESIYDCWPDLVTFEQEGWPKVSTLEMTDEEACDALHAEDLGFPCAHKFSEIKESVKKAIADGHDVTSVGFYDKAFPAGTFSFSNCDAEEWLGSSDEDVLSIIRKIGFYSASLPNGLALPASDVVSAYVASIGWKICSKLQCRRYKKKEQAR